MGRTIFFIMIFALVFKGTSTAQQITLQPIIPGQWLKSWLLADLFR